MPTACSRAFVITRNWRFRGWGCASFTASRLTLALLLSVLHRHCGGPIAVQAAGAPAAAAWRPARRRSSVGDYRPLPEPPERDEVGQLTRSFNAMTRQLDEARRMVESNRQQLERSNVYLESVLSNLSSGVLVFDEGFRVTTVNQGAQTILEADLRSVIGRAAGDR